MHKPTWPDSLQPADPHTVQRDLAQFWHELAALAPLLAAGELVLAAESIAHIRRLVVALMLALNGIARPPATTNLNTYLSDSQRAALEKTLLLPAATADALMAQAVALVTIYRWYAPQLLARYGGDYPQALEDLAWSELTTRLPDWPLLVSTD
jgi:hypothetical protein